MQHHFVELGIVIFLATLAAIFFGKIRQQPMIGYVLAGVLIGPSVLGLIENEAEIQLLAEMGIIMLLFILGMELPLKSFRRSYKVAVPITFLLIGLSLAVTFVIGMVADLTLAEKIVYGFIISLSSTAVAVKLLDDVEMKTKGPGQIVISILIAQDLLFVPMIVVINGLGEGGMTWEFVPKLLGAVVVLIGIMVFLSRKERIFLPFYKTVERHKDLIPVAALAWCFVGAGLSELASLSPAYGAFLAGLIIGNSYSKDMILPKIEPMQNVLLMVFFLSIGMLIDFEVLVSHAGLIFSLLLGAMVFKTIATVVLLRAFLPAERWRCSFVSGLTISQVGEFSFILAAAALSAEIFDPVSYKVIIAVIALSLALSPIWLLVLKQFVKITYVDESSKTLGSAIKAIVSKPTKEIAAE